MNKLEQFQGDQEIPVSRAHGALTSAREEIRSYIMNKFDVSEGTRGKIIQALDSFDLSEGVDSIHSKKPHFGDGTIEMKAANWIRYNLKDWLIIFNWPENEKAKQSELMRVLSDQEV